MIDPHTILTFEGESPWGPAEYRLVFTGTKYELQEKLDLQSLPSHYKNWKSMHSHEQQFAMLAEHLDKNAQGEIK